MAIDAEQYEMCKKRQHEEYKPDYGLHTQQANWQQAASEWKTCRWCGAQYKEVQTTKQVERNTERI